MPDAGHVYYEKPLFELLKRESIFRSLASQTLELLMDDDVAQGEFREIAQLLVKHDCARF